MTDDELDRALLALPLAEPPGGLRARILAATVQQPPAALAPWEIWAIGTLLALGVWLAWRIVAGNAPAQIAAAFALLRAGGGLDPLTAMWLAVGGSAAYWISRLTLMPRPPVPTYNR